MTTIDIQQLRAAREEMLGSRETRGRPVSGFEMREVPNGTGGSSLRFTGYASTTCATETDLTNSYELEDAYGPWTERMMRGCFRKTIAAGCDTNFVVNHEGVSMARTKAGSLKLHEDDTGLHTEALLNPTRPDVQILRAAIEDGAIDEMSFAFRVVRESWNAEGTSRCIREVSLAKGDVSAVNFGANDHTGGLVAIRDRLRAGVSERPARRSAGPLVLPPDSTIESAQRLAASRGRTFYEPSRSFLTPDPTIDAQIKIQARRLKDKHV